jgi:hypothetical protein
LVPKEIKAGGEGKQADFELKPFRSTRGEYPNEYGFKMSFDLKALRLPSF